MAISPKNKSRIAKYPPHHSWQGPIPISSHSWLRHSCLEIGIGPCHSWFGGYFAILDLFFLEIPPIPPWRKKNPYCREGGIGYYRHFFEKKSLLSRGWYWILPTFHFHLMTMIVPWAWLGGIADYHPHPSGLGNTHLLRRFAPEFGGYCPTPQDSDGNQQYLLAMLTVIPQF